MFKNKTYIGIAAIVLLFGIWAVPEIVERVKASNVVSGERLDNVSGKGRKNEKLLTIGKAPKYALISHTGEAFSSEQMKGKVHVIEFFFTTCPTICPIMNRNMREIEDKFFGNPNFGIVSITIDPETDTPEKLKEHAEELGVKSSNWHFLTGEREDIYGLANRGFNLYVGENKDIDGNFEHSGFFALVDKNGYIRSRRDDYGNPIVYYEGIDPQGVKAIMQDITILLNE